MYFDKSGFGSKKITLEDSKKIDKSITVKDVNNFKDDDEVSELASNPPTKIKRMRFNERASSDQKLVELKQAPYQSSFARKTHSLDSNNVDNFVVNS